MGFIVQAMVRAMAFNSYGQSIHSQVMSYAGGIAQMALHKERLTKEIRGTAQDCWMTVQISEREKLLVDAGNGC